MEPSNGDRKHDNSDSKKDCVEGNVSLTPIQKIPQEIWELILDNLDNSRDMISASNAVHLWKDILYPTRRAWMFDQILPLILPHLTSKKDVLSCRLVCTRWCLGVDYFLTNNEFQRPASPEPLFLQKISNRIYPLAELLKQFKLMYNPLVPLKKRIPSPTSSKIKLNIIGRSLAVSESIQTIQTPYLSNIPFLQKFGPQIQFLELHFTAVAPLEMLAQPSKILELVPNLKKLDLVNRHFRIFDLSYTDCPSSYQNLSAHLPKNLETLHLVVDRDHAPLAAILLSTFLSPKIKSLAVDPLPHLVIMEEISLSLPPLHILDLSVSIRQNNQWALLSSPDSPFKSCLISRLMVHIYTKFYTPVDIEPLTQILSKFKPTLNTFTLQLSYRYGGKNPKSCGENHFKFFAKKGSLNLPHLRRLSLVGKLPGSLNFILGVAGTLEYLHLDVHSYTRHRAVEILKLVRDRIMIGEEHCDLLRIIFFNMTLSKNRKKEMGKMIYVSNLWTLFPRLKVITVKYSWTFDEDNPGGMHHYVRWYYRMQIRDETSIEMREEDTTEWEFRRDIYEKLDEKN